MYHNGRLNYLTSNRSQFKKIGLVLGGGVVRGFAHIGIIKILSELEIPINLVVGASVGALVGALYCTGIKYDRMLEIASELNWMKIARLVWPRQGFLSLQPLEDWIRNKMGDIEFGDLAIPLALATTDLKSGEKLIIQSGNVARAVHASCSVPGIIQPVQIGDHLLGDGCLVDTIPVDVARALGAEYVIAVDLFQHKIRKSWGAFGYGVATLELIVRNSGGGLHQPDCLISPNLGGATYLRFSKSKELISLGQRSALEKLPLLKNDLLLDSGG
jgi:NTE family protein